MKKWVCRLLLAVLCLVLAWSLKRGDTFAQSGGSTLNFAILRSIPDTFTGFAFLNLGTEPVNLTAKAYGTSGAELGVAGPNPAVRTLPAGQQLSLLAPELFNFASPSNEGWVQVQASRDSVVGFQLIGSGSLSVLDGMNLPLTPFPAVVLTDIEYDTVYTTEVHVANPGSSTNNVTLELYNANGTQAGKFSAALAPLGKLGRKIQEIFPSLAQPFIGYLIVRGEQEVSAAELLVSGSALAALNGQRLQAGAAGSLTLYSAQLGNRRSVVFTRLNLVNPTERTAALVVRAVDDNGANLGSSPRTLTLGPGQQSRRDVAELFGIDPDRTTSGSLVIESDTLGVVGDVSFGDDSGANGFRASLPLDAEPSRLAAFAHVATAGVFITGVAVFNPNPQAANVTIRVSRSNGTQVGSTVRQVPPNGRFSKLLFPELVLTSGNQAGGFFTLESDQPITSFALFGALGGGSFTALSAIPPQRLAASTANNPVPSLASLNPSSAAAGGAAFSLAVSGSNFVQGSVVRWNGSARTTTFVSGSQLTAAITAADVAAAGTASVTVFNPAPGGGASGALSFTIGAAANPAPVLASVSPSSATAGGAAFTLTANGSGFVNGSVVRWNGSARTTTFVGSTQLTAAITAADIASAGSAAVTVFNAAPGGGTSSAQTFTINASANPVPAISSLSPASGTAGGAAFTLTVSGSNFVNASVVRWNGSDRATTFGSTSQLTAAITAADIAAAGSAAVTVFNPAPGGGLSGASNFTISGSGSSTGAKADYQFQDTRSSSVAGAPALADLSTNTFVTATVDGTTRTVLRFAANDGLSLTPTTGITSNGVYSVVVLSSFESLVGFIRILDFKNGTSDSGLYFRDGKLAFYLGAEATTGTIGTNTFAQVVLTRDSAKKVTGYVNGAKQIEFTDSQDLGLIDSNNTLRFFKDNTSGGTGGENSAGLVARIRIFDTALTAAEVAALDRLPPATPSTGTNLLRNPGAEEGAGSASGNDVLPPPGWTTTSNLTAVKYGAPNSPTLAESVRVSGGINFFAGGPSNALATAIQTVSVSAESTSIDAGSRTAVLRAHLTGFGDGDNAAVKAEFLNSGGSVLGTALTAGPVAAPANTFQLKEASGSVPSGTRSIRVTLTSTRVSGSYNDGYFDNIFLALNSNSTPAPAIEVTPASLTFGDVTVGQTKDLTLTVRNSGTAALTVNSMSSSNPAFSAVLPAVPFSVSAGAEQSVTVRFSPAAAGSQTGSLAIASNDSARPSVTVALSGNGATTSAPAIVVTPASFDFGEVALGQTKTLQMTLRNNGNAALSVTDVNSSSSQYGVTAPVTPFSIAAGGEQGIPVRFTPTAAGAQSGTLTVTSNDPSRPSVAVPLSGTGQASGSGGAPVISNVTVNRLALGALEVTVVVADPDGLAVRFDFEFYQGAAFRTTLTEINSSGYPNGTVAFTLSLGPQASALDRVDVQATDAGGNKSSKFTRNF